MNRILLSVGAALALGCFAAPVMAHGPAGCHRTVVVRREVVRPVICERAGVLSCPVVVPEVVVAPCAPEVVAPVVVTHPRVVVHRCFRPVRVCR
jgi:hypothetical protein